MAIVPPEIGEIILSHYKSHEIFIHYIYQAWDVYHIGKKEKIRKITLKALKCIRLVCVGLYVSVEFMMEHTNCDFGRSWGSDVMWFNAQLASLPSRDVHTRHNMIRWVNERQTAKYYWNRIISPRTKIYRIGRILRSPLHDSFIAQTARENLANQQTDANTDRTAVAAQIISEYKNLMIISDLDPQSISENGRVYYYNMGAVPKVRARCSVNHRDSDNLFMRSSEGGVSAQQTIRGKRKNIKFANHARKRREHKANRISRTKIQTGCRQVNAVKYRF